MKIFFYGLFMDKALLAEKGIYPESAAAGYVEGFALHIGARATLLPADGARVYGVMMNIPRDNASKLYAEESVADYVPEPVDVVTLDGRKAEAVCYNLPAGKISGSNKDYAASLLKLAEELGFPDPYLDEIRNAAA